MTRNTEGIPAQAEMLLTLAEWLEAKQATDASEAAGKADRSKQFKNLTLEGKRAQTDELLAEIHARKRVCALDPAALRLLAQQPAPRSEALTLRERIPIVYKALRSAMKYMEGEGWDTDEQETALHVLRLMMVEVNATQAPLEPI